MIQIVFDPPMPAINFVNHAEPFQKIMSNNAVVDKSAAIMAKIGDPCLTVLVGAPWSEYRSTHRSILCKAIGKVLEAKPPTTIRTIDEGVSNNKWVLITLNNVEDAEKLLAQKAVFHRRKRMVIVFRRIKLRAYQTTAFKIKYLRNENDA